MQDTLKSLSYAVRRKVLIKYLGLLALIMAGLVMAPLAVSVWFGEYALSQRYLLVIILLLIVGIPSLRIEHPTDVQHNESLTITALAFVMAPFIMAYPMMGSGLSFIDAWFEATSAITTTGLSTIADLESMPRAFLFSRAWMQWYGGLGIIVVSVAIVMNHHIALRRLVNPEGETMVTTARIYAHRMLIVYVTLTLIGFTLLLLLLDNSFMAVTFTLSAISTGGFAPLNNSIAGLSWQAQLGIMLLSFMGAIPFILYYRFSRGSWREVLGDVEVRTLLGITLMLSALLSVTLDLNLNRDMGWSATLFQSLLLGISAQSTTGFSSLNIAMLDSISLGLIIVAMIIGGGVGSTAGGFKILRLLILLRLIQLLIQRTSVPPHAVVEPKLANKPLNSDEIERALLLIILFVITILISWLIFLAYGYSPLPSLFEVTSAIATTGLSSSITSETLETPLKIVLGINMLLGRIEIIALMVVLYPGTWVGPINKV